MHEWLEAPEGNQATTSLTEHRSELSGRQLLQHGVQGRGDAIRAALFINSPQNSHGVSGFLKPQINCTFLPTLMGDLGRLVLYANLAMPSDRFFIHFWAVRHLLWDEVSEMPADVRWK